MNDFATEHTRRAALLDRQRRILDRIASGARLADTLNTLVELVEEQANGMRCAVLLADSAGRRLRFVAAPNVPADYKAGIEPYLCIGPNMGSCGTAAFLRKPVHTKDTGTDALWHDCRDIAVRNGLRAIWSTPILGDDYTVLGTFAMYYGKPRLPSPEHIQLIDMAVQMARVAIEAGRTEDALRRSEASLRLVIDTIPTMAWSVLPDGTVDFLNRRWLDYAGLTLEEYIEQPTRAIHPDDIARVLEKWRLAMAAGGPYEDEMRLRGADETYRWFLVRTVPLRDDHGNIIKWYGTSTDIEDRKQAEDTLRRNQAFFSSEAQRIGHLLGPAAQSTGLEHPAGGGSVAADRKRATATAPPDAEAVGRTTPEDPRLVAERQALESLTSHERAILRLISEGKSNAEAAERLHLSPRTIETYRARLMEKLRLKDLAALVKFAIRNGMSSVD